MSLSELDAAILDGWMDVEAAATHAQAMEDRVVAAVDATVERWAKARDWSGRFKTESELFVSPPQWTLAGGKKPIVDAKFELVTDDDEGVDWFFLTALMGLSDNRAYFRLDQNRVKDKKVWTNTVKDPANVARLPTFKLNNEPTFERCIVIDKSAIQDAFATDSFDAAMEPLRAILDELEAAVGVIDPWLGPRARS